MEEKESLETRTPVGNMETESIPVNTGFAGSVGGEILPLVMSTAGNTGGLGVVQGVDSTGKKKRGRPRKYDSDGNLRVGYVKSPPSQIRTPPPGFTLSHSSDYTSSKKSRGRPPGSGNWQVLASLGELFALTAGGDFTPHVLNVYTGEDVAEKISSISQKGPRGICILAANGAVSNVTIRQPGSSGGILTYEGRFEILSLTGSFTISENGGVKSRTGGLSVSLAGPDGRVIGGGVAGLLMAASPIQIVVGSFVPNGYISHKRKYQQEAVLPPNVISTPDVVASATPISQASHIVDNVVHSTTTQLPFHNHVGTDDKCMNENPKIVSNTGTADWNGAEPIFHPRVYPDINVSAPIE